MAKYILRAKGNLIKHSCHPLKVRIKDKQFTFDKQLINQKTAMKIRNQRGIETDSFTGRVVNME